MSNSNDNSDKPKDKSTIDPSVPATNAKKKAFGTLKPLTAIQIIGLLAPSSPAGANCY